MCIYRTLILSTQVVYSKKTLSLSFHDDDGGGCGDNDVADAVAVVVGGGSLRWLGDLAALATAVADAAGMALDRRSLYVDEVTKRG